MAGKPDLGELLAQAAQHWRGRLRADVSARGFAFYSEARSEVLAHVPAEGVAQAALSARMGITKQAVQQLVDQLVADGAVQREPHPTDKRLKVVRLTELGEKAREQAERTRRSMETDIRAAIGDKGFRRLRKELRKLAEARD